MKVHKQPPINSRGGHKWSYSDFVQVTFADFVSYLCYSDVVVALDFEQVYVNNIAFFYFIFFIGGILNMSAAKRKKLDAGKDLGARYAESSVKIFYLHELGTFVRHFENGYS